MEELRYEDSAIDERILMAVKELGFEVMTPIQAEAIPAMLEGKDLIGQAQTGTGKTAAFGIPVLQNVDVNNPNPQAIILCPTRELAIQAADEIRKYAKYMSGIRVLPIYGGQDIMKQIKSLRGNVQIIVGTPGRVMDHMRRHTLKLDNLKVVVLDEADEMLDMGFREDIETIFDGIPSDHQTALFSATMAKAILDITKSYQKPDAVFFHMPAKELTVPLVKQYYYEVRRKDKTEVVSRLLDYYNPKRSLIFCNTKKMVDELVDSLIGRGYFAAGLHGDLSQMQRDRVMASFRNGQDEILIATDVAARGIDVDDVEAVFNYDVPQDIEYYVHRIGRTGRAGKKGRAFTLVVGREIEKIREIERTCKTKIKVRVVPSADDIKTSKSDKILSRILELQQGTDLTEMIRIIEQKLNDEDCTAIDLAAAFLKEQMGEEPLDMSKDDFYSENRKRWDDDKRYSGGKSKKGGKWDYGKKSDGQKNWRHDKKDWNRDGSHDKKDWNKEGSRDKKDWNKDGNSGKKKNWKKDDIGDRKAFRKHDEKKSADKKDDRVKLDKVKAKDIGFDGKLKKTSKKN